MKEGLIPRVLLNSLVSLGFGFVEFENGRVSCCVVPCHTLNLSQPFVRQDAEDALNAFNGKSFMGTKFVPSYPITVERG